MKRIENARKLTEMVIKDLVIECQIERAIDKSYQMGYIFVLEVARQCLSKEEYDRLKNALKFNNAII